MFRFLGGGTRASEEDRRQPEQRSINLSSDDWLVVLSDSAAIAALNAGHYPMQLRLGRFDEAFANGVLDNYLQARPGYLGLSIDVLVSFIYTHKEVVRRFFREVAREDSVIRQRLNALDAATRWYILGQFFQMQISHVTEEKLDASLSVFRNYPELGQFFSEEADSCESLKDYCEDEPDISMPALLAKYPELNQFFDLLSKYKDEILTLLLPIFDKYQTVGQFFDRLRQHKEDMLDTLEPVFQEFPELGQFFAEGVDSLDGLRTYFGNRLFQPDSAFAVTKLFSPEQLDLRVMNGFVRGDDAVSLMALGRFVSRVSIPMVVDSDFGHDTRRVGGVSFLDFVSDCPAPDALLPSFVVEVEFRMPELLLTGSHLPEYSTLLSRWSRWLGRLPDSVECIRMVVSYEPHNERPTIPLALAHYWLHSLAERRFPRLRELHFQLGKDFNFSNEAANEYVDYFGQDPTFDLDLNSTIRYGFYNGPFGLEDAGCMRPALADSRYEQLKQRYFRIRELLDDGRWKLAEAASRDSQWNRLPTLFGGIRQPLPLTALAASAAQAAGTLEVRTPGEGCLGLGANRVAMFRSFLWRRKVFMACMDLPTSAEFEPPASMAAGPA